MFYFPFIKNNLLAQLITSLYTNVVTSGWAVKRPRFTKTFLFAIQKVLKISFLYDYLPTNFINFEFLTAKSPSGTSGIMKKFAAVNIRLESEITSPIIGDEMIKYLCYVPTSYLQNLAIHRFTVLLFYRISRSVQYVGRPFIDLDDIEGTEGFVARIFELF